MMYTEHSLVRLVLRRYSEELDPGSPDDEQQGSQCDDTNPNPNPSGGEEDQAVKGCMGAVLGWGKFPKPVLDPS